MIWAAAAGVAFAVGGWLRRLDDLLWVRIRLGFEAGRSGPRASARGIALVITIVIACAVPGWSTQFAVLALGAALAFALGLRSQAIDRHKAHELRAESARFLRATAADLRAGVAATEALRAAAGQSSPQWKAMWAPVVASNPFDVVDALAHVATQAGGTALADAAAAWSIADATGAPLAGVLDRVAEAVQADVELHNEVAVEAAPARATARLMAFLPLAGVGLGMLLGVNPLGILLATPLGAICLVTGLAFVCTGVWWIERLVIAVEA